MQERIFARSNQNGINFYSNVLMGTALKAFLDENGKLKTERVIPGTANMEILEDATILPKETRNKNKKKALIIGAFIIALSIASLELMIIMATIYFSLLGLNEVFDFVELVKIYKKDFNGRNISGFHAAKHKALNAYAKNGNLVPTKQEVKDASWYSGECETIPAIRKVVHAISFPILLSLSAINMSIYISGIVVYVILYFLEKKFSYLRIFECFVLSEPSDEQIELAIEGIRAWKEMEKDLAKDFENGGILVRFNEDHEGLIMQIEVHFGESYVENAEKEKDVT